MKPHVILLDGPSSSGKSTLAEALQTLIREQTSERYEVVSIDDFLKMSPDKTIYEDDVFEISDGLCERALEILQTVKRRHHRSCDQQRTDFHTSEREAFRLSYADGARYLPAASVKTEGTCAGRQKSRIC